MTKELKVNTENLGAAIALLLFSSMMGMMAIKLPFLGLIQSKIYYLLLALIMIPMIIFMLGFSYFLNRGLYYE